MNLATSWQLLARLRILLGGKTEERSIGFAPSGLSLSCFSTFAPAQLRLTRGRPCGEFDKITRWFYTG